MNTEPLVPPNLDKLLRLARESDEHACARAIHNESPDIAALASLLSPAAGRLLDEMAARAQALTRRHFGRTIQLYAPLYLSNFCTSGCAYCGFASNREQPRRKLGNDEILAEMLALKGMGIQEILLLTGERGPEADFEYLRHAVSLAAEHFHLVTIETFPMSREEYRILSESGCAGITVYQETYDRQVYALMHRHGPKRDYHGRLQTPANALSGGFRFAGMGVLLGLADPVADALCLFHHIQILRKEFWQAGFSVSFPRIRPQTGGFLPPKIVHDSFLAQMIFAFRICMPDTSLVVSTRESASFRDGVAGIGISKMSVASRTTVGGYHGESASDEGQFAVNDTRDAPSFCAALRRKGLEPVFKNWDSTYRGGSL